MTVQQAIGQVDRVLMLAVVSSTYVSAKHIYDVLASFCRIMYGLGVEMENLVCDYPQEPDREVKPPLTNWYQWKHEVKKDLRRGLIVPEDIPKAISDIRSALNRWDAFKHGLQEWVYLGAQLVQNLDRQNVLVVRRKSH